MTDPKDTQEHIRQVLVALGEDPSREGLEKTPERVEKALRFLTQGYAQDPDEILKKALFTVSYDEMVIIKDIDVYSLCEHHLLPFFGKAHVAYLPKGKVLGLSKVPRLVDVFARRLQVQERLTVQIANWLQEQLAPKGVGVVIEAEHMCMSLRGVQASGSRTITSCVHGVLREDARSRQEFFALTGGR
jgi:GTP cyclohydrolase I